MFSGRVADVTFRALDLLKQLMADLGRALQAGTDFPVSPSGPAMIAELRRVQEGGVNSAKAASAIPVERTTAADAGAPAAGGVGEATPSAAGAGPAVATDANAPTLVKPSMKVDTEKIDNLLDTIGELVITESMVINSPEIKAIHSHSLERNLSQLAKITRVLQNMSMSMRLIPRAWWTSSAIRWCT